MATVATVMRTIAGTAYGELLTLPTRSPRRSLRSSVAGAPYDAHSLVGSRCSPRRLVGRSAPQSLALPTVLTPSSAHAAHPVASSVAPLLSRWRSLRCSLPPRLTLP